MINENILNGKWTQVKGRIQKAWSALTDDELEGAKGDINKLGGLIQQKYGETQESVRTKVNDFIKDIDKEEPARKSDSFNPNANY